MEIKVPRDQTPGWVVYRYLDHILDQFHNQKYEKTCEVIQVTDFATLQSLAISLDEHLIYK